jgi:hypothetical protein
MLKECYNVGFKRSPTTTSLNLKLRHNANDFDLAKKSLGIGGT